jgi:hypothetical protein
VDGLALGLAKRLLDSFLEGYAVLDGLELGNATVLLDGDLLGHIFLGMKEGFLDGFILGWRFLEG